MPADQTETSNADITPALSLLDGLAPGFVLDERFEILSFLGKSGMSVVYKARHMVMDRLVTVRMLHRNLVVDADSIRRFQREAAAVSTLDHANIVAVYGFGSWKSQPYMVMEYLEGISLADVLAREHRLTKAQAIPIFGQICDALAHAHDKGVIHRDLKPSNMMSTKGDSFRWQRLRMCTAARP